MPFDPTAPAFVPRSFATPSPPPAGPSAAIPAANGQGTANALAARKKKTKPKKKGPTPAPLAASTTTTPPPSKPSPAPSFGASDFPSLSADAAKSPTPAWGPPASARSWASAAAAPPPPPAAAPAARPSEEAAAAAATTEGADGAEGDDSIPSSPDKKAAEDDAFVYSATVETDAPAPPAGDAIQPPAPADGASDVAPPASPPPATPAPGPLVKEAAAPAAAASVANPTPPPTSVREPAHEQPIAPLKEPAQASVDSSPAAPSDATDPLPSTSREAARDDPLQSASSPSEPITTAPAAAASSTAMAAAAPEDEEARRAAIHSAITNDELYKLQRIFSSSSEPYFSLSNDPLNQHTLSTPLLLAASKGRLKILKFLIEEGGALLDLEDGEGENVLHKAALHSHVPVLTYLLSDRSMGPHARDREGFTALHAACSRGHLDAVVLLLGAGAGAYDPDEEGEGRERGLDRKAKGGWTPLMCAAAGGHVDVVRHLVETAGADPLVRNGALETAADIAAGVFEVYIYDILVRAELDRWPDVSAPKVEKYNALAVHSTVPVVVLENQRLDGSLKSRATHGGKAVFTSSGLGRLGRKDKWELRELASAGEGEGVRVSGGKEQVRLPSRDEPFELRVVDDGAPEGESAHFWLSDWAVDFSNPLADPASGWSYAPSFSTPAASWTPTPPAALDALLSSNTLSSLAPRPTPTPEVAAQQGSAPWVRRRRWVRTMSRRLDLPPLPLLDRDGFLSNGRAASADDSLEPGVGSFPTSAHSSGSAATVRPSERQSVDYLMTARRVLDGRGRRRSSSATDVRAERGGLAGKLERAKLERAVALLDKGIDGDGNAARVQTSRSLLAELKDRLASQTGSSLRVSHEDDGAAGDDSGSDSDASEFVYTDASSARSDSSNAAPTTPSAASSPDRAPSKARSVAGSPGGELKDYSGVQPFPLPRGESALKTTVAKPPPPPSPVDQAAEAAVALPNKVVWQKDADISSCQRCSKGFGLFTRKHHCRRCAHIFCAACSGRRVRLPPAQIVLKPDTPFSALAAEAAKTHRVCDLCMDDAELKDWLA